MKRRLVGFIILTCFIFTFLACKHSTTPIAETSCDSAILDRFIAGADSLKSQPPELLHYTISYYDSTPASCRNIISELICNKAFAAIYRQQDLDTIGIPFLNKMAHEEALTVSHSALASLKVAAYYLYGIRDADKALPALMEVKAKEAKLNHEASKVFNASMSQYYNQKANYKEACVYFLKSIKIAEIDKDSVSIAANSINFSSVYAKMGNYEGGLRLAQKALHLFSALKDPMGTSYAYQKVGAMYTNLEMYDSAEIAYLNVLKIVDSSASDPTLTFQTYLSLADNAITRGSVPQAINYYDKARGLLAILKDEKHQQFFIIASTSVFATIRPVDKEIALLKKYIEQLWAINDLANLHTAYLALHKTYENLGQSELALENFVKSDSIDHLISSKANKEYITEMNTKLEAEQKQLLIQVQDKDIKELKFRIAFIAALILILIIVVAFSLARRRLKRNQRNIQIRSQFTQQLLLNTERERNRIADYLHERVGNKLLTLKENLETNDNKQKETVNAIINEIDIISQDLYPAILDNSGLEASIHHICNEMSRSGKINITSEIDYSLSLNKTQELQVFRMIQEALNNIVKYANADTAQVKLKEDTDYVTAKIMDTGHGFNVDKALDSGAAFGLINIKERSKALNGNAQITSNNAGTRIYIKIPRNPFGK